MSNRYWSSAPNDNRTAPNLPYIFDPNAVNSGTGFYRFGMYCQPYPNNTWINWQLDSFLGGSGVGGTITGSLPVGSTAMRPIVSLNGGGSGIKSINTAVVYVETLASPFE